MLASVLMELWQGSVVFIYVSCISGATETNPSTWTKLPARMWSEKTTQPLPFRVLKPQFPDKKAAETNPVPSDSLLAHKFRGRVGLRRGWMQLKGGCDWGVDEVSKTSWKLKLSRINNDNKPWPFISLSFSFLWGLNGGISSLELCTPFLYCRSFDTQR